MTLTESHDPANAPPVLAPEPSFAPGYEIIEAHAVGSWNVVSCCVTWVVIVAVLAFHAFNVAVSEVETRVEATSIDLMQINLVAKFAVGTKQLSNDQTFPFKASEFGADDFPELHWCNSILLNEVGGANAALKHVEKIQNELDDHLISLTVKQAQLADILTRILTDYAQKDWSASNVSTDERKLVTERLGFCGTLVLTPEQGPDRSARDRLEKQAATFTVVTIGIMLLVGLVLLVGCVGFCVALAALIAGKFRFHFGREAGRGHIYGETFAIWFLMFTIMQVVIGETVPRHLVLIAVGIGFFASLAALAWPMVRGVSWQDVRRDIGWRLETNPLLEAFYGAAAYICLTPLILCSLILVVILANFFGPIGLLPIGQFDGKNAPSHPIVFELAKNDPFVVITALILACVAAPIVEETMFRGVLYRHLRDSTIWFRGFVSVFLSASINALIFAAIHPQGLLGIPVLGTLAFGFSLVREWRDSLIAPMVMHAINNGTMTLLLLLVLNGLN